MARISDCYFETIMGKPVQVPANMMKTSVNLHGFGMTFFAALMIFPGLLPTGLIAEEFREFTNSSGKTIKAVVIAATATDVTLKMEDGRELTGGVSFFSESDRAFIETWRKANPSKIAYDFEVTLTRDRADRRKTTEGNMLIVYETWKYSIKVENKSKSGSGGITTSGLELRYNVAKTAKARAQQSRELNDGLTPAGALLVRAGSAKLGNLEYLRSVQVETETIPITLSELAPGWYFADGSKDENNDELEGIWVQIVEGDTVIYEKKLGSKAAADAKWVSPSGGSAKAN